MVQLIPALTDFMRLTNLICYRQDCVTANMGNLKKQVERISIYHIPLVAGPLERSSTVVSNLNLCLEGSRNGGAFFNIFCYSKL